MAYDRAKWHYGGDYPSGLPPEGGGTHIGMFLGWAIKRGLVGALHAEYSVDAVAAVRDGALSGRDFLLRHCDETLTEEELSDEGNQFAKTYYRTQYLRDYEACLGADLDSIYRVADSPENRARLEARLDQRFDSWRAARGQPKA